MKELVDQRFRINLTQCERWKAGRLMNQDIKPFLSCRGREKLRQRERERERKRERERESKRERS